MNQHHKELRYSIRDEIEETIKIKNIDRKLFYEVPKSENFYDFYIISKNFDWLIVYSVDGDSLFTIKNDNQSE